MRKFVLLLLIAIICSLCRDAQTQTLTLSMPDTTVAPGAVIDLPISCRGFDEIVSMQFSMQWDVSVIEYQETVAGELENVAVGDFNSNAGELRFSWFDIEGTGQSLPDGSIITYLRFIARGAEGDSTPVEFADTPLRIQIYEAGANPGEYEAVEFDPVRGLVRISALPNISVAEEVSQISCAGAADGQIALNINFDDNYLINWTGPDFTSNESAISNLEPGDYKVQITDTEANPLYESTIQITEPAPFLISAINTEDADCVSGRGSATVEISGGTFPYIYDIGNGPGVPAQLESLEAGDYILTLTDANGCTTNDNFTINSPDVLQFDLGQSKLICNGQSVTLEAGTFAAYEWSTGASTSSIQVSEPGNYSLTVTNAEGCQASDQVEVQQGGNISDLDLGPDLRICPGETATLQAGSFTAYVWSTGATGPSLEINEPGNYSLTVTNAQGCQVSDQVEVQSGGPLPVVELGPDLQLCDGEIATLQGGNFSSYRWSTGASTPTIQVSDSGTYALTVTNAGGCEGSGQIRVESVGSLIIELGTSQSVCPGGTVTLSTGSYETYLWSTGETTASIEVSEPGYYSLSVTNEEGCLGRNTVEVRSGEDVQVLIENDFMDICPGDSIRLSVSGADSYTWIDTSGSLSALDIARPYASPDVTVGYQVIGASACGKDTVDLEVFVYPVTAMAGPDTCIGPGTEAQLMAFGGISYLWEDARYPVSDRTSPTPTVSPDDSITYVVAITDYQGCTIRDSLTVLVANDPVGSVVAVNMITPNGDEKNDVLYFKNIAKYGQNSLKVFNRWGNVVYQKVNYQSDEERFDGTYKGQELPAGTYYYLLSFRSGEIKQKLTILR